MPSPDRARRRRARLPRRSASAAQSLAAEVARLHAMTVEERVLEALGLAGQHEWVRPVPKPRP